MSKTTKQTPPHNAEAERAVLGAMFKQPNALISALESLRVDDFYIPAHREIFAVIEALHNKGLPVDEITVIEELEKQEALTKSGGIAYITDLQRALPALTNLSHYIALLREKATMRRLLHSCQEIEDNIFQNNEEATTILSLAEKQIFDVSMQNVSSGLEQIESAVSNSYLRIAENAAHIGLTGLATGFEMLDQKLSGLQKSDLVVIAARPAMGKTSFAINIAQHASLHEDAVVAIFSLEMSRDQLVTRMLCTEARVDMHRAKTGQLTPDDWTSLAAVMDRISKSDCFIDDTAGISLSEMRSKLRRLKIQKGKLDLVIIDYLQLMTYRGKADNRQQEVSETTRQLKIMARDLDVPILLLSQLSRAPDQRTDHRPLLSDLRESGSIEQDADIVIMLYRESAYDPECENPHLASAIVSKHRNGSTGDIPLVWRGEYTLFENMSEFDEAPAF